jgi:hypothetical protein
MSKTVRRPPGSERVVSTPVGLLRTIHSGAAGNGLAIDRNFVVLGVDALPGLGDGAVDADASSGNEFLCPATRRDSGARQRALNSH